ncbi:hypothetical protein PR202_gb01819 [Eleusine coracana subsp. coracana]|uniref:Uncharacterized protein n=1 Tax=Eleusine coracana subsp. coracana TaxID=191504 RepID=A0AAV5DXN7_ELECO|nr:hypothetical protein PR202_gb01819 [Eleusine coracana subsp. coracana]
MTAEADASKSIAFPGRLAAVIKADAVTPLLTDAGESQTRGMASSPHLHLLPLLLLLAVLLAAAGPSSAAEPRVIRLPTERKAARACAAPPDPAVYTTPRMKQESHSTLFAQCLGFELVSMIVSKVYVSTVEAYKYPITCTQWHPEKAIFEWRKPMIPHSEDAVQSQARKSPNRPPADKVLNNLIYNYRSTFSGKTSKSFEEIYIFF